MGPGFADGLAKSMVGAIVILAVVLFGMFETVAYFVRHVTVAIGWR